MPQKVIHIHSITPGSLADKCNKFEVGDEIVMVGNTTMAGLTWKAASEKVKKLFGTFKIVAKRKTGSKQQQRSLEDFPDGFMKATMQHQNSTDNKSNQFLSLKPPSTTPPELPYGAPPTTSPTDTMSVDSFDSESGDEYLLQQENSIPSPNVPLQNTRPAHAISMDSFDSESGDEELMLKEKILSVPPNLPSTVPLQSLAVNVTKPAQAISMDSFESESGDELLLQQEETIQKLFIHSPTPPSSPTLQCSSNPTLQCSSNPTLQCSSNPTLQCSSSPTLQCSSRKHSFSTYNIS